MKQEVVSGKAILHRTTEEKTPYMQRLARIEGQVRGLRKMIEDNRTCSEEIQQANAIIAAVREVALMLISQQLRLQVGIIAGQRDDSPAVQEFADLLRATFKLQ